MTTTLPPEFADLEPFADWCLATEAERYAKRLASSMDEMQTFYDAAFPRLEAVLAYLDELDLDDASRGRRPAPHCCATPWSTSRFRSRCGARQGCPTAVRPAWTPSSSRPSDLPARPVPVRRKESVRMRIGVMVGPERGRYSTKVERMLADARWAEDAGLASVWVPQIPDDFDALTAATLIGLRTVASRSGRQWCRCSPGIPSPWPTRLLSVQAVCEGRLTLGLGVSHHWVIDEMLGLPYEHPAATMRAYLDVLDAALARARDGRRRERDVPGAQPRSTSPISARPR